MTRDLPMGWGEATTEELFSSVTSGSRGWAKYYSDQGAAFIRVGNLDRNTVELDLSRLQRVAPPQNAEGERTRVLPGDLLITITADIGMVAIAPSEIEKSYVNQHVALARPHLPQSSRYLGWFLVSKPGQRQLGLMNKGATKAGLGLDDIKRVTVPIPPLAEQRRIVAKIEALLERGRRARDALDSIPALLDRYRQSILAAAFRGDLTAEWREKHPSTETGAQLLARLPPRSNAPAPESRWTSHHPIPVSWAWTTLARVSDIKGGLAKGKKRGNGQQVRPIPYLRVANVQRGYLDLSEVKEIDATDAEIADLQLLPGDMLFNEGGDRDKLGRGWVWEGQIDACIHQNHVFRARAISAEMEPRLMSMYTNTFGQSYFLGEGKQTTNLASISKAKLSALPVPVIPIDEQQILWRELSLQMAKVDAIDEQLQRQANNLSTLTQSILAKAFRGELVPQDSNDEPASVLLDRIRAERAAAPVKAKRGRKAQ